MNNYPHLFSPLRVRDTVLRNRIFVAPTQEAGLTPENFPAELSLAYYSDKAKGGAAVVTIGGTAVNKDGRTHPSNYNIFEEEGLRYLSRLTDAIHAYGALASIELTHGGKYSPAKLIGRDPLGPSECMSTSLNLRTRDAVLDTHIHAMTPEEMEQTAEDFANATLYVRRAGFDMVHLHAGHGWLLSQFLSPAINKRTDEYGGSFENRARFPKMVVERIREKVGPDFLIEMRVSADEFMEGGINLEECVKFIKLVEDKIDFVQVSVGTREVPVGRTICIPSGFLPPAPLAHYAIDVKAAGVKVPVIAVGGIMDPAIAEELIASGKVDAVAMARAQIADPEWPNKCRAGKFDEVRPCIKCYNCHDERVARFNSPRRFACSVNPELGREIWCEQVKGSGRKKKVVVIGGGPAGIEAACVAAAEGHEVILYEKSDKLGGQLNFAHQVSFKYDLANYRDYMVRWLDRSNVAVRMNTEATPERIAADNPHVVIAAVGSSPKLPPIPGADGANVLTAHASYDNEDKVGQKIVVVGGGEVGCETALHFAMDRGRQVSILEMQDKMAPDAPYSPRSALIDEVEKYLDWHVNARVTAITDKGVSYTDGDGEHFIEADTVIVSVGSRPCIEEAEAFRDVAFEYYAVGDCVQAKNIRFGIRSAYDVARSL